MSWKNTVLMSYTHQCGHTRRTKDYLVADKGEHTICNSCWKDVKSGIKTWTEIRELCNVHRERKINDPERNS